MEHFWQGFTKGSVQAVQFKRHVVLLCFKEGKEEDGVRDTLRQLAKKSPSVKVKILNADKDPEKAKRHNVTTFPTVLLLKDGREVDRVTPTDSSLLLSELFRKAHV